MRAIQLTGTNARRLDHKLCSISITSQSSRHKQVFERILTTRTSQSLLLSFLCSLEGTKALIHSGGYYREATPVPIPNTEVKLAGADNTRLATAREDRLLPDLTSPFTE